MSQFLGRVKSSEHQTDEGLHSRIDGLSAVGVAVSPEELRDVCGGATAKLICSTAPVCTWNADKSEYVCECTVNNH